MRFHWENILREVTGNTMILADIIRLAERLAPPFLALEGDPIGLQIGNPDTEVQKVAVCLDATGPVLLEAGREGAEAIFSHHPLIYAPVTSLAENTPQGRLLSEFVRSGIALYTLHTNWDVAIGGLNDALAQMLGLGEVEPLEITHRHKYFKVAVFTPEEAEEAVRIAAGNAGAGVIGNYSHCSFRCAGTGTFRPLEGADPSVGQVGSLEQVQELKLEFMVAEGFLRDVLEAVVRVHPYEEVAYDAYEVLYDGLKFGIGRLGRLEQAVPYRIFKDTIAQTLGNPPLRCVGEDARMIKTVAVCGGSGGHLVELAATKGADVLVTSEVKQHQFILAQQLGIAVVDATHQATESLGMHHFARRLAREVEGEVEVVFIGE